MNAEIVEIARIKLRPGRSEADLVSASEAFQRGFLDAQPGFVRRELLRLDAGNFADLVHWRSRADADAVMEKAMASPACENYFSVMDMDAANPEEGVTHFVSLARYG